MKVKGKGGRGKVNVKRDGERTWEGKGFGRVRGEREGKGHSNGKGRRGVKIEKGFGKKWENKGSGGGKGKVKRRKLIEKRT